MVSYRAYTVRQAQSLGLSGWVRNLPDGRVEAVFEGTPAAIAAMIRWCHRGSPAARVQEVVVEGEEPEGIEGFAMQ
jgi:acylphosphatase